MNYFFRRLINLLDKSFGNVLYKGLGESSLEHKFLPFYLVNTDFKDALMKEEVPSIPSNLNESFVDRRSSARFSPLSRSLPSMMLWSV